MLSEVLGNWKTIALALTQESGSRVSVDLLFVFKWYHQPVWGKQKNLLIEKLCHISFVLLNVEVVCDRA